jgi:hypothetical protein
MMAKVTLIFGRNKAAIGLLIRLFGLCAWQHVGIYIERLGVVYESIGSRYKGRRGRRKGLVKTDISAFKKRYTAWRTKEVWTDNENFEEDCEALYQKGLDYDYAGVISKFYLFQLFRINIGSKHDDNCSEFVNRVLKRFIGEHSPDVRDWWVMAK